MLTSCIDNLESNMAGIHLCAKKKGGRRDNDSRPVLTADDLAKDVIEQVGLMTGGLEGHGLAHAMSARDITGLEHYIRNKSRGIDEHDLRKSLKKRLEPYVKNPYFQSVSDAVWSAFNAVFPDESSMVDRVARDICDMAAHWTYDEAADTVKPTAEEILYLQQFIVDHMDTLSKRHLKAAIQRYLPNNSHFNKSARYIWRAMNVVYTRGEEW